MTTTRRQFVQSLPAFAVAGHMLLESSPAQAASAAPPEGHFHPQGKAPSEFTKEVLRKAKATLPFGDKRDFEEQQKGFIAPMKDLKIKTTTVVSSGTWSSSSSSISRTSSIPSIRRCTASPG
jgi:alkyl sulfatase BDS1-like metallo-beta-lactamase superfamily hydrolase